MVKMCGNGADFALVKQERSRTIVGYELKPLEGSALSEWHEVYFPRKKVDLPSIGQVKNAMMDDIDRQTNEKILKECPWTVLHGDDAGKQVTLWLNDENQRNYSEGQRVAQMTNGANLPMKVKVSENEDKTAVYDIFETVEEITQFYLAGVNFIKTTLAEGWVRKDAIDWAPYEAALEALKPKE